MGLLALARTVALGFATGTAAESGACGGVGETDEAA